MRGEWMLWLLLVGRVAVGAEDDDSQALSLGANSHATIAALPFSLTTEAAVTAAAQRNNGWDYAERISFDFRYDSRLSRELRIVFADLLDIENSQQLNTLKEAYLSWQPYENLLTDAGRINVHQGVAVGYNPTDFLRQGALRTVDSLDPNSLRQNRLGTVMARQQVLWDTGSITALFAPHLVDNPSPAVFSPDLGATNNQSRWLLMLTERHFLPALSPQWVVFGQAGGPPQVGVNVTYGVGSATVLYAEAATGRQPSLWAQAQNQPDEIALRTRVATGVTYTTLNKISVTLEYEYNGAGLSGNGWNAARNSDPERYGRYRELVGTNQDLPTEHNAAVYVTRQDAFVRHLDLTGFVRMDPVDHSYLPWLEARYHWTRLDAAMRWQDYLGSATSDLGASASRGTWQLLFDYYL